MLHLYYIVGVSLALFLGYKFHKYKINKTIEEMQEQSRIERKKLSKALVEFEEELENKRLNFEDNFRKRLEMEKPKLFEEFEKLKTKSHEFKLIGNRDELIKLIYDYLKQRGYDKVNVENIFVHAYNMSNSGFFFKANLSGDLEIVWTQLKSAFPKVFTDSSLITASCCVYFKK